MPPPVIIGLTDKIRRWGGEGGDWPVVTTTTSSLKGKYRQPFHNKRSNGDKILDQLKYQQKVYSLELQRSRSFVLNPLVDLVFLLVSICLYFRVVPLNSGGEDDCPPPPR